METKDNKKYIVCRNIRTYRKARNMSQGDLAKAIHRSLGFINKIENAWKDTETAKARGEIETADIYLIASGLQIPTTWLFEDADHTADLKLTKRHNIEEILYLFGDDTETDATRNTHTATRTTINIPSGTKDLGALVAEIKELTPIQQSILRVALGLVDEKVEVTTKPYGQEETQ